MIPYYSAATARDLPPMIIDSFAGGGGASTGIELALGRSPDVAINHSAAALALHAANHPETLHLDSNIWDVKPAEVTRGRKVGLLWASPDCKHFSKAKGGAPRDRNIRDLAWVVVDWAEQVKPDVIAMENVEEFVTWGPIDNDGQPIREFTGQTFDLWVKRLKRAGYRVQWRELRACDYGAPTIRKRWFLIARRDGRPIAWPKPTHGDPKSPEVKRGKLLPWRTAAECIDWSISCPSIFDTAAQILDKHGARAIRPLAPNTLARIARGMQRYVLQSDRPFLVSLKGTDRRDMAVDGPHPTVLAGGGHSALIAPSITRFNGGATGQDMREPLATVTANSWIKKPGGAAPLGLIAPVLTYAQQGGGNRMVTDPHHTICASKKDQNCLLSPYLASIAHGDSGGRREYPLTDPLGTVTVGGIQHACVAPVLVQAGYGEAPGQAPRALDIGAPLGTVVAGGVKHALVAPHIMTMRNAGKPFNGADEPAHTITAGGAGLSSVAAFLAQHNTGVIGHDPRDPLSTIAATGSHQNPVAAFFAKYYGAGTGAGTDEPCHTITVNDRFGHVQAAMQAPPFAQEHEARARDVARFLRDHGAWDGGEFVTLQVDGATFVVVDIGMRMLTPRELFNAQGFPADYVIEGHWQDQGGDWVFKPFPKDVQVSCCGNSVCPDLARAIIAANCGHLRVQDKEQWEARNG